MPHIQVTLKNEDGTTTQTTFELTGELDSLGAIDEAVEQFKNQALPVIEQQLLHKAQEQTVSAEKKTVATSKRK